MIYEIKQNVLHENISLAKRMKYMKPLLIFVWTIARIVVVFLATICLTGVLFFQFLYNEQNENVVVYIHIAVAFLINFIWYRWKEKKTVDHS